MEWLLKFLENQERIIQDQYVNFNDPINLGLESNIRKETVGHPYNQEDKQKYKI